MMPNKNENTNINTVNATNISINTNKNKDNVKITKRCMLIFVMVALMAITLGGCKLAKEDGISAGDTLCGLFLVYEKDLGGYVMQTGGEYRNENGKWMFYGADGTVREASEKEVNGGPRKIEGTLGKDGIYDFNGIKGEYIMYERKKEKINGKIESFLSSSASKDVFEVKLNVGSDISDNGSEIYTDNNSFSFSNLFNTKDKNKEPFNTIKESTEIIGTVAIPREFSGNLMANRIFKRGDGSVYTIITSDCLYVDKMNFPPDNSYSAVSVSEKYNSNSTLIGGDKNDTVKSRGYKFEFRVIKKDFLKSALIKEMDKNDTLIKMTEAKIDTDSEFVLSKDTSYIIVEEALIGYDGKEYTKRYVYDSEEFYKNKDGLERTLSHTFYFTDKNDRISLFSLSLKKQ